MWEPRLSWKGIRSPYINSWGMCVDQFVGLMGNCRDPEQSSHQRKEISTGSCILLRDRFVYMFGELLAAILVVVSIALNETDVLPWSEWILTASGVAIVNQLLPTSTTAVTVTRE